jgi:hypothetical protein
MHRFPFSEEEWSRVNQAAADIVNQGLMDDPVLRDAGVAEMCAILNDLRQRHGEHPILLETQADFLNDNVESQSLYRQAIALAVANGLLTYTARISLANVLLTEFHDCDAARLQLIQCEHELEQNADAQEQEQWAELMAQCTGASNKGGRPQR